MGFAEMNDKSSNESNNIVGSKYEYFSYLCNCRYLFSFPQMTHEPSRPIAGKNEYVGIYLL